MKRTMALFLALMLMLSAPAHAFWPFDWFGGDDAEPASATPTESPTEVPADMPAETPDATPAAVQAPDGALPSLPDASEPESRETDESALIRVFLKTISDKQALGLTLEGLYTVEHDAGFRFAVDTDLAVAADGKNLLLSVGGLTINMGTSFTLTRHMEDDGSLGGIQIHETDRANLYMGDVQLTNVAGSINVVVTLDIEDYLYGVVPYEMSDSFPIEALKAQAVAARTFAMSRKLSTRAYDVVDTTDDQVYRGFNPDYTNTIEAVDSTRGVVGLYLDKYATCYFTASNGGQTVMPDQIWGGAGDYGWLDVRDDPYDLANPSSPVKSLTISADPDQLDGGLKSKLRAGLTEQLAALGYSDEVSDIKIVKIVSVEPADPKYGEGNRMFRKIRVGMTLEAKRLYAPDPTPDAQTVPLNQVETVAGTLYADLDFYGDLKPNYGLKISGINCEVASVTSMVAGRAAADGEEPDSFVIESRRFGHGVGMSQRGAQQMARAADAAWTQILNFYYPGMTLVKAEYARTEPTQLAALSSSLGKARPRPTPKPTPAPLPALESGEAYAKVTLGSAGSTLNVREGAGTGEKLLGTFDNGQRVIITEELDNGWARVKTAELTGYASMEYLTRE